METWIITAGIFMATIIFWSIFWLANLYHKIGVIEKHIESTNNNIEEIHKEQNELKSKINDIEHKLELLEPISKLLSTIGSEQIEKTFKGGKK